MQSFVSCWTWHLLRSVEMLGTTSTMTQWHVQGDLNPQYMLWKSQILHSSVLIPQMPEPGSCSEPPIFNSNTAHPPPTLFLEHLFLYWWCSVMQLVETLRYKLEGRRFVPWWGHWDF